MRSLGEKGTFLYNIQTTEIFLVVHNIRQCSSIFMLKIMDMCIIKCNINLSNYCYITEPSFNCIYKEKIKIKFERNKKSVYKMRHWWLWTYCRQSTLCYITLFSTYFNMSNTSKSLIRVYFSNLILVSEKIIIFFLLTILDCRLIRMI